MAGGLRQIVRYVAAVVFSPAIGGLVAIPFAITIDVLWGGSVTGGRWPLTIPNVVLIFIEALATGFAAGWIAGRRGKLMAALADFFLLTLFVVVSLALNRDLMPDNRFDTKPAFWVWIGLAPAMLAGHFAVKWKHLGFGATLAVIASAVLLFVKLGATAFHVYTCYVAYEISGTGAAVLTLFFPIFSELTWAWRLWDAAGTLWNLYTFRLLLVVGWYDTGLLLAALGVGIAARRERDALQPGGAATRTY